MANPLLTLNLGELTKGLTALTEEVQDKLELAAKKLSIQTHAHVEEQAAAKLHSRLQLFNDNLSWNELEKGVFAVTIAGPAVWIEDGMCVVYGKHKHHIPEILTPDGWVDILKIKVGDLVLNQNSKWTKVIQIYDNPLLSNDIIEFIDEKLTFEKYGYVSSSLSPRSKKSIILRCPKCDTSRSDTKFNWSYKHQTYCKVCSKNSMLVSLGIHRQKRDRKLVVTAEHKILTDKGWLQAKDITKQHQIMAPFWGKCLECGDKVIFGGDFCKSKCAASFMNKKNLASGTHVSQDPNWLSEVYKKKVATGKRISGAEEIVSSYIQKTATVSLYSDNTQTDWIRQYPIEKGYDKLNRKRYYFLDFYNPKLHLCLEVDGKVFHSQIKDDERDRYLKSKGIDTIRVPAKLAYKPYQLNQTMSAILANHLGEIELRPVPINFVKHFNYSDDCPLNRRWDITVEDGDSFVCQWGIIHNSQHEMLEDLLKSPKAKTSKTGNRYIVIPFKHSKGPTKQTKVEKKLLSAIKNELTKRNIPYMKTEVNPDGSPKTGLLHSFDLSTPNTQHPRKPGETGPQGKGFSIAHRPGSQEGPSGRPYLWGVRIYQKLTKDGDAQRGIFTFRVASDSQKGSGKWVHPGLGPMHFLEDGYEYAKNLWDTQIAPELLQGLK
jgi:hypothetical protein